MLESRSSYGYYGWAGGFSGENPPKKPHESGYHYSSWFVKVREDVGVCGLGIRARSKENAIKQIEKMVRESNSEKNLSEKNPWKRKSQILEVYWDSLRKC